MGKIVSLLFLLLTSLFCQSQDLSNKGKDFWIAYPAHVDAATSVMGIYITSDQAATGNVQIGGNTIPFSIAANTVRTVFVGPNGEASSAGIYLSQIDGIATNAAVHVTSNRPVVVYGHIIKQARSGASLLLPSTVWGREYLVPSFRSSGESGPNSGIGIITIVAKDTNTVVEINPKATSVSGRPAGTAYSITLLQPGDVYQVQYKKDADISGTTVRSISTGNSVCKPIAVFSSSTWSAFDCNGATGGDNLFQQLFPVRSFGKAFLTAPFFSRNYDIIRVFVSDPTAIVTRKENGNNTTLTGLQANSFYEFSSSLPNMIESDKPISVVQYITSQSCLSQPTNGGDPEMVILSPLEQTTNNITVFSAHQNFVPAGQSNVNRCYLNIIIKTAAAPTFRVNGNPPTGQFTVIPGTGYSFLQQDVSAISSANPIQTLKADSNFAAIAYGFGNVESYGYNAGTNVRDLYQYISIKNQYATVNYPATCVNTPFEIGIILPYKTTKLFWEFYGKSPDVNVSSPVADSSFVVDGKTLYRYRLPGSYNFNTVGSFPVTVTASNPSSDGCDGEQQIDYDLQVYDKPKAKFSFTHTGCITDPVQFRDTSVTSNGIIKRWIWNFGDNSVDSIKNPVKKYLAGGTFTIKESIITDIGCIADTTAIITVSVPPIANFNILSPFCEGSKIEFKDASTIVSGNITRWYWDYGNGKKDTLTTNINGSSVYTAGTYVVSLIVEASGGCKSEVISKSITVSTLPKVDFNLPGVVCLPIGIASFINQSSIAAPDVLTYKWEFGDGNSATTTNPVHKYTGAGPFNVKLTATSNTGCIKDSVKVFSNVFLQPKADFNINSPVCLGDSSLFTDATIVNNQVIVKYGWNLGTKSDSSKNVFFTYDSAASYQVKHWVISDKGCSSDTVTKTHIVNVLPTAMFTIGAVTCQDKAVTFTSQSIANSGTINRYQWSLGNGITKDEPNGNAFQQIYAATGIYQVELVVTSSLGCKSAPATKSLPIGSAPVVVFSVPEICLADAFAQFTDSSTIADGSTNAFSYLWNFGDANANAANPNTSQVKDPRHRYTATGNYTVSLSVTSKDGCTTTLGKPFTVNGDKPKADFDIVNNNACSNSALQIINRSTVNFGKITKTEIYWEWPASTEKTIDSFPTQNEIYQHSYKPFQTPINRTFNIRMLSYSGGVCVNEIIKVVTLSASPGLVFNQMPGFCFDGNARQINTVSNIGNLAGTGLFYGNGVSTQGLFDPSKSGIGNHTIRYQFTTTAGCVDSAFQTIKVWEAPTADFKIIQPVCVNQLTTFTSNASTSIGKIITWNWDFGDGTTLNKLDSSAVTKIYSAIGQYKIQLQIKTDSGCTSAIATNITDVKSVPVVDFDIPVLCVNTIETFTDKSSIADGSQNQFTYKWNFGIAGSGSSQKNPLFAYSSTGNYIVKLEVTSKDGCVNSLTKPVSNIYPQPMANFLVAPSTICLGETASFTNQSNSLSQSIKQLNWNLDDGTTLSDQQFTHLFSTAKSYDVSLFYTTIEGCNSDTVIKRVVVSPLPEVNAGPDQFILAGGQKQLMATVSGSSGYQYNWSPSLGLNAATNLQPIASPSNSTNYTLTVTAAGGCQATDQVYVQFVDAPIIPNAFSPNGDGINDTWGIKYFDSYPGSTIIVFDRYGKQVYAGNGSSRPWNGFFGGKPIPIGVYYYVIDPKLGKPALTGSLTIMR